MSVSRKHAGIERERKRGADSKPCKSTGLFRCRRRAEETTALGAREQRSEYQREGKIEVEYKRVRDREGERERES